MYTRMSSTWIPSPQPLTANGETGTSGFGASMDLSADGKTAIFGGPNDNSGAGIIPTGAAVDPSGRYFYVAISDTDGSYPVTVGANPADPNFPQERLVKVDSQKTTNGGVVYVAGRNGSSGGVAVNSSGNAFIVTASTRVEKFDSLGTVLFSANYLPSWATTSSGKKMAFKRFRPSA